VVSIALASWEKETEMDSPKMFACWLSRLVLILVSSGITSAQNSAPVEIGMAQDGISIVGSTAPNTNTSSRPEVQQEQAAAKPGSVIGTVLDQTKSVASGVVVRVTSEDNYFTQTLVTGDKGQFSFSKVPRGRFKLSVSAEGFGNQEFFGELTSGQTYLVPPIVISIATVVTDVKVAVDPVEVATEEVKEQEQQRVLRIIPNFYVSYHPDAAPLTTKLKFRLAWKSSTDPVTILGTAFLAGLQQAADQYPEFGQGALGYGKRFGAGYVDVFASTFLSGAVFPSLLQQDPRYYYQGIGSERSRIVYAVGDSVMCKGDNGHWQVNYSNIAGAFAGAALSSTFYPTTNSGMFILSNGFIRLGESSLAGVLQEFVLRKLTKMKRQAADRSGPPGVAAETQSDPVPPAKEP
jgi:hypothetical protein